MTKPPFNPSFHLRRLEDVTATSSARITKLQADIEWYQNALDEKHVWAKNEQARAEWLARQNIRLWILLFLCWLLAGATELAFR